MGHNDGSWDAGQWLAMGTTVLLFSGVVIGLVVWAVRSYRNGSKPSQTNGASTAGPDSVLAKRFARGEIEEDEYLRRRDLLHSATASRSGSKRSP